ncbi:MAG TPA: protein phosphatase 2C domain-containing protein [Opitutaceae bacterium]|nr:protein phosphatase 2C domain-containing protein [Opitutaceae bacterium]
MGPTPASDTARDLAVHWSGLTDRGRIRKNNEDAFLALAVDGHGVHHLGKVGESTLARSDFIFAVSDGMGGANAGEFASRIAVDRITRLMARSFRVSAQGINSGFSDILGELFSQIHHDLLRLGYSYEECAGMGATLSLGWLTPGWLYFAHVGDSRIYYLPATGGLTQLTHDHTHVGWQRRTGRINEREARTHPGRNSLQQALGAGHQIMDPHIGAVSVQPGDRLLFCSDGLVDGLWDRRIEEAIRQPEPARAAEPPAKRLVEEAKESSRDNITAVVVELHPPSPAA